MMKFTIFLLTVLNGLFYTIQARELIPIDEERSIKFGLHENVQWDLLRFDLIHREFKFFPMSPKPENNEAIFVLGYEYSSPRNHPLSVGMVNFQTLTAEIDSRSEYFVIVNTKGEPLVIDSILITRHHINEEGHMMIQKEMIGDQNKGMWCVTMQGAKDHIPCMLTHGCADLHAGINCSPCLFFDIKQHANGTKHYMEPFHSARCMDYILVSMVTIRQKFTELVKKHAAAQKAHHHPGGWPIFGRDTTIDGFNGPEL